MKERRKYIPLIYLLLECLGILEGLLVGYFLFGKNPVFVAVALGLALALAIFLISKTIDIYKTRCKYIEVGGIHAKKRIRVDRQAPRHY